MKTALLVIDVREPSRHRPFFTAQGLPAHRVAPELHIGRVAWALEHRP